MTRAALCVVRLGATSGRDKDVVENTFAFHDGVANAAVDIAAAQAALLSFYNDEIETAGGFFSVANWIGATVSRAADRCEFTWYDIVPTFTGGGLGSPISHSTWALAAGAASSPLPLEVSLCLSFHADLAGLAENVAAGVAGPAEDLHPRARHRGRVYIGPLMTNALGAAASEPIPVPNLVNTLAAKGEQLQILEGTDAEWCVWSRAAANLFPVTGGFVDREFDTQRRRQHEAPSRLLWPEAV